jgi:pilus assembly protein CpaB
MIKGQALSGKSNKVLIFLGLFLGLVSAVLVVVYLKSAGGESSGDTSGAVLTPVVVAKADISAGTAITEENWQQMVEIKEFTSDVVLAGAYRDTGDVIGFVTRVPLVAGEQVIPTKVTATGAAIADGENPPLAYVVPEGKRGVAIQVSSVIGASGLVRPGDYVDVILTVRIEPADTTEGGSVTGGVTLESGKDQIARTVLQNAQVLTIDQDVAVTAAGEGTEGAPAVGEDSEANPEATTVTLAVSPVHGEVLSAAETCGENFSGRLALSLRRFGDGSAVETRSVWDQGGPAPTCAALLGLSTVQ